MFDAVLEKALRDRVRKWSIPLASVDGTGLESRHVSRYYVKRRSSSGDLSQEITYAKYPKAVLVVDCKSHMILAAVPGRGPSSDLVQFRSALEQTVLRARIRTLLADAGFDAEWAHLDARSFGIRTIIPPTQGRPTDKPPTGHWRRVMKQRFARYKPTYGQRWQVETVNSMIKRRLGSALRARQYQSQCTEIILKAITHNVMIVQIEVFYRASASLFPSPKKNQSRPSFLPQTFTLRQCDWPSTIRCDWVSCHQAGQPATFTGRRMPRRSAISRSLARVVAKERPSIRPSRSFSIRFCQLWALQPSRSNIPASSAEILASPWRTRRPVWIKIHRQDAKSAEKGHEPAQHPSTICSVSCLPCPNDVRHIDRLFPSRSWRLRGEQGDPSR